MKINRKKLLAMLLALVMSITCLVSPAMATPAEAQTSETHESHYVDGELVVEATEKDTTLVDILVSVEGETAFMQTSDLEVAVAAMDDQRAGLYAAQSSMESTLGQSVEIDHYYSLVFNGFAFKGEAWMVDAINQIEGLSAIVTPMLELVEPVAEDEVADLTPAMATSTDMTGAIDAWDMGYTGKGMVVAVIDTGIKQTHEAFSVAPEGARIDEAYLENVFAQYGELMHCQNTEGAYYSAKLPYNWDYFDGDCIPNHTSSTHGSHVAGIVAGNNGNDFKGVAPDAQIITLQIFNKSGGASVADMLSALEDCVYLGVDVINMSLGIAAGFEHLSWLGMEDVYTALEKGGVAICSAASNDAHAYVGTNYGNPSYTSRRRWLSSNPDNGLIGAPGTFAASFTVGNSNALSRGMTVTITASGYTFNSVSSANKATPDIGTLGSGSFDVVLIGSGSPEEIAAVGGVEGKIALAKVNEDQTADAMNAEADEVCANAAAAGAIGILLYGSKNSGTAVTMNVSSTIPFATVSENFARVPIIQHTMKGGTSGIINLNVQVFSYDRVTMHYSSSWGPTVSLKIKPEITAPGVNILSADGAKNNADNAYVKNTGTSMAAPAVAGGVLLMKQHLKTLFPDATGKELYEMSYALMMSTAGHANAFVRHQGSGIMNLENAVKSTAYLTTTEDTRPKLELDDSADGTFAISFKVRNFGKTDKTYDIDFTALTENVTEFVYDGWQGDGGLDWARLLRHRPIMSEPQTVNLLTGSIKKVTDMCTLEGEKTVNVKAGETATVTLTLKANQELMDYFQEKCPAGMYLEGWINLTDRAEDGTDLSIPYLGFVGDWDAPAMFDEGWWWQEAYGINNMSQMYNSGNDGGIYAGFGTGTLENGLGVNMYADGKGETYLSDRNAISPNGDGYQDALNALEFSMLRQPRRVHVYLQDQEGNVLHTFVDSRYSYRREYWVSSNTNLGYGQYELEYDWNSLAENTTVELVAEAYLDRDEYVLENNKLGRFAVPVTIDLTAPAVTAVDGGIEILDTNYIAYYAIYADAQRNNLVFEDGVFAMERGVKETYATDMTEYFVSVADFAHNEAFYMVRDGVVYEMDAKGFDHGRTIIAQSHFDMDGCEHGSFSDECKHFAWYAFNEDFKQMPVALTEVTTEVDNPGTEGKSDIINMGQAANGTIYASDNQYLYTFDLETMTVDRENRIKYWYADQYEKYIPFCKAFFVAPGTNDLYAVFEKLTSSTTNTHLCSVNPETGELTMLWSMSNYQYPRYAIKDANTIILWNRDHLLEEFDIATGEKKSSIAMGTKLPSGKCAYGQRGYTFPMVYDAVENCLYMAGAWSYFSCERWEQGGVLRYDYDTGSVEMYIPGSGAGLALFGLLILDEDAGQCIYYRQDVAPTCDTEGYTLHTCVDCGHEYRDNFVPALGHNYEAVVTEPTCTDMGYTTYTCTVCGDTYVGDEVAALGHDYEAVVTAPTCTALGYTTYTCKVCGDTYKDDYTPTTDHKYGQWQTVTAPTCTTKGQEKRVCECGAAEYRNTDMAGHDYEAVVTDPTCTTLGYTTYTCKVCGDSYKSDFVETIGHKYTEEVVAPTCTDMGYTIYTCDCGHRYEGNFVLPAGHRFGDWEVTKEATCTEKGEETRTCACGETETRATDKAEHKMEEVVTEPTCTEVGYTTHTCTVCGHSYITDLKQATGHDYGAVVTAPTCTEEGYTTYTCACGESYVDDYTDALGHTFGQWTESKAPACNVPGEETHTCEVCDATETRETVTVCPAEDFTDVDTAQWYHEGVCYVLRNGLMEGKGEGIFAPNANLTRAELVTVLYRMAGTPSVEGMTHPFTDVAEDTWYTDVVIWAYNDEVVNGISETAFAPGANITREQIATILYRYAEAEAVEEDALADFADADKVSDWAVEAMNWAVSVGLINGMDETTLAPQGNATRAQIATILMRYCEN